MKKIKVIALAVILCIGLLYGCGDSYAADESTVFIRKDGSVVSTDVEEFDENTYDTDSLKSYVNDAIDSYNGEYGNNSVKLKKLTVKDGKATLTIQYASAADYQRFNDIELYTGSVTEALAAGYSFDDTFASVKDGQITLCEDASEFLNDASYKVVIIRSNTNVQVKGSIAYVSAANTNYVDDKTISIKEGTSILSSESVSDDTESATEVISTQEDTQAQETSGSVSEDELLEVGEESTEMVFDFGSDDSESTDDTSELSQIYTYIIYK
jgi:hypothetical protein